MKVEINMINVEDGDAIIVTLEKEDNKALILIDGGYKKHYPKLKKRLKELLPDFNNTIDLIICTHYDNDHLRGIREVLNDFTDNIQQIWMHKAGDAIQEDIDVLDKEIKLLESKKGDEKVNKSFEKHEGVKMIEGYKDLMKTLKEIQALGLQNKLIEATAGTKLEGFEEFKVVSPTIEYYNQHLDDLKGDIHKHLFEGHKHVDEFEHFVEANSEMRDLLNIANPCEKLQTSSWGNGVSTTNMLSIVTLLNTGDRKYLFTGDAGIETFTEQNLLEGELLQNLNWLDLPHHGSKNNTSKEMLDHFNPTCVFVSGDGSSKRPDKYIEACLQQRGKDVYVTNRPEDTWYLRLDNEMEVKREPWA